MKAASQPAHGRDFRSPIFMDYSVPAGAHWSPHLGSGQPLAEFDSKLEPGFKERLEYGQY